MNELDNQNTCSSSAVEPATCHGDRDVSCCAFNYLTLTAHGFARRFQAYKMIIAPGNCAELFFKHTKVLEKEVKVKGDIYAPWWLANFQEHLGHLSFCSLLSQFFTQCPQSVLRNHFLVPSICVCVCARVRVCAGVYNTVAVHYILCSEQTWPLKILLTTTLRY